MQDMVYIDIKYSILHTSTERFERMMSLTSVITKVNASCNDGKNIASLAMIARLVMFLFQFRSCPVQGPCRSIVQYSTVVDWERNLRRANIPKYSRHTEVS